MQELINDILKLSAKYLHYELRKNKDYKNKFIDSSNFVDIIFLIKKKYIEKEKQAIIEAYEEGDNIGYRYWVTGTECNYINGEDYYNETFKSR